MTDEARVMLVIALLIGVSRLLGRAAARLGQPRMIGEIATGIALGPSLLGWLLPDVAGWLFSAETMKGVQLLAQVGIVLFMFLVGTDLETGRNHGRRIAVLGQATIVLPFAMGALLGLVSHPWMGGTTGRLEFTVFVGAAVGVTAFPVLARILQVTGLARTRVGSTAIACAAINDVYAWALLTVAVVLGGPVGPAAVVVAVGGGAALLAVFVLVVRPLLTRVDGAPLWLALALALSAAAFTDLIGLHAAFGAFVAGLTIPRDERWRGPLEALRPVVSALLLPVLFAAIGLSTEVGSLDDAAAWLFLVAVLAVAVLSKLGGTAVAARALGSSWRESVLLGVLMNTRGLTEVVLLQVGLQAGLIGPTAFTALVLMALVTTAMTTPLVRRLQRGLPPEDAGSLPVRDAAEPSDAARARVTTAQQ